MRRPNLLFTLLPLILLSPFNSGSQYPIPTSWVNTTSSLTREARFQTAQDALELLLPQISSTSQLQDLVGLDNEAAAGTTWVIILQDLFSDSTANEALVTELITSIQPSLDTFTHNSDRLFWGLVCSYAYRAYNNSMLLDLIKGIWDDVSSWVVLPGQFTASQYNKNEAIEPTCYGKTTAGGVFWGRAAEDDLEVNGDTIGPFVALSAYLYEATQNTTYLSYAELATAFIQAHLFDGQLITDSIYINASCITRPSTPSTMWTYDSAFVIEAWSVLADITQNDTLKTSRDNLVFNSVSSSFWTSPTGINSEMPKVATDGNDQKGGFKGYLIRGLHTAWMRSDPASDIAQLIAAYITIQFNTLLSQAAIASQPNAYSNQWADTPPFSFQTYPQATALHVLIPAFTLTDSSSSGPNVSVSDPNSKPSPSNQIGTGGIPVPKSSGRISTGAEIGAIVGGVIGISCLAALLVLLIRRRRYNRLQINTSVPVHPQIGAIVPFRQTSQPDMAPDSPHSRRLSQKRLAAAARRYVDLDRRFERSDHEQNPDAEGTSSRGDTASARAHQLPRTFQSFMRAFEARSWRLLPNIQDEEPPEYEPPLPEPPGYRLRDSGSDTRLHV